MPFKDFREFLELLEKAGLLYSLDREVDKDWELSAIARWVYTGFPEEERFALKFQRVKGHSMPVVVGAIGASYKTLALALGIDSTQPKRQVLMEVRERWKRALKQPVGPRVVSDGACKENIIKEETVDVHILPAPVWARGKDGGFGYLTSPYHVARDPDTGLTNIGTYRTMIREERNLLGIFTAPGSHLYDIFKRNERRGRPTEIATVIGADPSLGLVSVTPIPSTLDEMAVAGGLRGAPIELVKCETVALEVPANAEIVIEGRLLPASERPYEIEGPFGEFTGYEGDAGYAPLYEVTCITFRNNPIFQAFASQKPPSEGLLLSAHCWAGLALSRLEALGIPGIVDIRTDYDGAFVAVAIAKQYEGHPAAVANAIFSIFQPRGGKFVIVTDEDVDIYDDADLWWAILYRTSLTPNKTGVHFVEGLRHATLDYSAATSMEMFRKVEEWPAKGLFIDATRPYKPYPIISLPPREDLERVRDNWEEYQLPTIKRKEMPRCLELEERYIREGISALPGKLK